MAAHAQVVSYPAQVACRCAAWTLRLLRQATQLSRAQRVLSATRRIWFRCLRRRSQKSRRMSWLEFEIPDARFTLQSHTLLELGRRLGYDAGYSREEPGAGNPPAGSVRAKPNGIATDPRSPSDSDGLLNTVIAEITPVNCKTCREKHQPAVRLPRTPQKSRPRSGLEVCCFLGSASRVSGAVGVGAGRRRACRRRRSDIPRGSACPRTSHSRISRVARGIARLGGERGNPKYAASCRDGASSATDGPWAPAAGTKRHRHSRRVCRFRAPVRRHRDCRSCRARCSPDRHRASSCHHRLVEEVFPSPGWRAR